LETQVDTIEKTQSDAARKRLPVLGDAANVDIDVEAELKKFEIEQMAALGLESGKEHWRDDNPTTFTGGQRAHTTLLISGLTMAHDLFLQGALRGIGYKVKAIDVPDNSALTFGKEFGNRGQCNPTYFTVGNLTTLMMYAGLGVATFFLILFLQQVAGYSPVKSGASLLPITVVVFLLSKRFGVAAADQLVPWHPTLGDVDSLQALADYQAAKRAHKKEWNKAPTVAG